MENHFWNHWTGKINVAVPLRRCVKARFATIPLNYYGKSLPTVIECIAIKRISLFRTEFCVNNICWQLKVKNAENVIFDSKEHLLRVRIYFGSTIVTFVKVPKHTIEFLTVDKDVQGINDEHRNIHRLSNWKFNWITHVFLS